MLKKTYYDILEVSPKASQSVILAAYRSLSNRYHPDKNSGDVNATEMMTLINNAYDILSDQIKRDEYDKKLQSKNNINVSNHPSPPVIVSGSDVATPEMTTGNTWSPVWGFAIIIIFVFIILIGNNTNNTSASLAIADQKIKHEPTIEEGQKKFEHAMRLLTGNGEPQNYQKALEELQEITNADSYFYIVNMCGVVDQNIAAIYYNGLGVPRSYELAANWYKKAAIYRAKECGGIQFFMLGLMHEKGQGVAKDLVAAYHYYNIAASSNSYTEYIKAKDRKNALEKVLTQEQINRAQNME